MKSDQDDSPENRPVQRSASSESSCVSMKSDQSVGRIITFGDRPVQKKTCPSPEFSCLSMKSDQSVYRVITFSDDSTENRGVQREGSEITGRNMETSVQNLDYPSYPGDVPVGGDDTLHAFGDRMKQDDLATTSQTTLALSCHQRLKFTLGEKCQKRTEGILKTGSLVHLHEIYTELYIVEEGSDEANKEHEVSQIEAASRRRDTQEIPIKCNDILKHKDKVIRTVLTKGVAGIGKTVSVQKFILDWAEGTANQDVLFIFPLPFRKLNLIKEEKLSLVNLLHRFFTDTKNLKPEEFHHNKVLFIFDGLDECRLPLDFQNSESVSDVTQSASVDVLLTNLIKGKLLPSALIWITTRPAAADQIPADCINQVTEIRGFSDLQKEEYFRKRFREEHVAERIITHLKSSRSLYIMCHIPVFCWITGSVLERILGESEISEIPKTLTEMFTQFIVFQIKHSRKKYQEKGDVDHEQAREIILALGKLAFQQLEKGNLIFYEEDLIKCGIDVREASVYSGVCTQIFWEESGLHLGRVFSFVHLSAQEFLAALYVILSFIFKNKNVLQRQHFPTKSTLSDVLKCAVDKALESETGHLNLFLRFLSGLSLESNQTILQGLLSQRVSTSHNTEEIIKYIKDKTCETTPEKTINLFHCLNELNDHSLQQKVQSYVNKEAIGGSCDPKFCPGQWSALAFIMLNSENQLEEFDLRRYHQSEECLLSLLPVIRTCRNVILPKCNLTGKSCAALASALSSNSSCIRELDLSYNKLQDSGVKLLCDGLKSSQCKLEKLGLECCSIGKEGCTALTAALTSNPTHLQELNIKHNKPGNSGVKLLQTLVEDPQCKLDKLLID
uniref:NACHT domain-containing protein n=1 Tax=Astyanax mexicanus TaxID=7994 RepID=A0A8B9L4J7_ASTMX